MVVMVVYVLLVFVGELVAFLIARAFDSLVSDAWSMIFFMTLFFGVIAFMWPVAVWITEKWFVKPEGTVRNTVAR